jgi:hypothetical protein
MVTDTPTSRFVFTRQVSSEGSQKEQQAPLLNKARARAAELGDAWERAFELAVRLENTFGPGGLDDTVQLQTAWQPLEARDEVAELEQAKLRKELGMPIRLVARGLDLSQEDVALWEEQAAQAQAQFSQNIAANGNEGGPQSG